MKRPKEKSEFLIQFSFLFSLLFICYLFIYLFHSGSNPGEVDGYFQDVKILITSPPGGTFSRESRV